MNGRVLVVIKKKGNQAWRGLVTCQEHGKSVGDLGTEPGNPSSESSAPRALPCRKVRNFNRILPVVKRAADVKLHFNSFVWLHKGIFQ